MSNNISRNILTINAIVFLTLFTPLFGSAQTTPKPSGVPPAQPRDWLVEPIPAKASVVLHNNDLELNNGLVRRVFRLSPNVACYDYVNLTNQQQLLRAVKPEARVTINGNEYQVGGLIGQKENAYFQPQMFDRMTVGANDFRFSKYEVNELKPFLPLVKRFWSSTAMNPTGKEVVFEYTPPAGLEGIRLKVHYELFDGIPLIVKWISIENKSALSYKIDRVVSEVLGIVEEESAVEGRSEQMLKQHGIYIESNYAFNNAMRYDISDQTTHWKTDPSYTSQVHYRYQTPCLLEIYPDKAPGIELQPGETFNSIRTHELLMDSYDRQRRGLMIKRMYSMVAPWARQNPIFMHLVSRNDEQVRTAIDQCLATGYEAVILSFGSHLNMEDSSLKNIARWKELADYAHGKGIMLGGYSLFSSRKISEADDVIDPKTGKTGHAFFGNAPCFGSVWGLNYRNKIKYFFEQTGFDIWENDGPYPGDVCASTTHPGHKGLDDSQWRQMEIQKDLYRWLNQRGVYINAPDWYFLDGTHKIAIGYREVNFSLSRDQQRILNRQNIHDGTIEKSASMSWGFVPLTKYQGGDSTAILEPLSQHLRDYEQLMLQYYGAGVQACYRGPRLYDTEETRQMVASTISWYKKYRDILNADMIHMRRADGRDWDGYIHVNPSLKQKGFVMLFNPLKTSITRTITIPLYYTGLKTTATLQNMQGVKRQYKLDNDQNIRVQVTISPESHTWFVIE